MTASPDLRPPRLFGLALVLLIHILAAGLLLTQLRRPAAAPKHRPGLVTLSLQPLPKAPPAPTVRSTQATAAPATRWSEPQPDTRPAHEPVASTITPSTQAITSPPPLNLALPSRPASSPERWRNPALSDPRANTQRLDAGARMAAALGTDLRLHEESLGDGRHRFRQGGKCWQTSEQRIQQLDPFNTSMSVAPRLVTACN